MSKTDPANGQRRVGNPIHFLVTKEYRRFEEFCKACRRDRYIGLCYGPPGVGKTLSARQYARWDAIKALQPFEDTPKELAACRTIFYTPEVTNSARIIKADITRGMQRLIALVREANEALSKPTPGIGDQTLSAIDYRTYCELIIVDETDRLKMPGLEQLRDIYDRTGIGLVLIGMPGLEKRLARYPQLYSRVGFAHAFRALSNDEMQFILDHHWEKLGATLDMTEFTDQEAVAAIIRITAGNFRLLNRLFAQIERILKVNDLQTITQEVVEAARECLVIGVS